MSVVPSSHPLHLGGRRARGRLGDLVLHGVTLAAALAGVAVLVLIGLEVVEGSHRAFGRFGLHFLASSAWNPVKDVYGAWPYVYGTLVSSLLALAIATPLSIAIGLYLSELAPRGVRGAIGALVEMLAAIPSVVLGLWGILVLGPFVRAHVEPWLNHTLGFTRIFDGPYSGFGLLPAILILTIMIVPIVSSICRELFLAVPSELEEGALALGTTRWEMIRGVILPAARPGIAAAAILGLGRAVGEAIAVSQVIGNSNGGIARSLFAPSNTLASGIANEFQGATSKLQVSSLFYLATILLAIGLAVNLLAQLIVRRFEFRRTGVD